jgi:hypothetical protein
MSKNVSLKLCLAMDSRRDMVMFDCYTKLVFAEPPRRLGHLVTSRR